MRLYLASGASSFEQEESNPQSYTNRPSNRFASCPFIFALTLLPLHSLCGSVTLWFIFFRRRVSPKSQTPYGSSRIFKFRNSIGEPSDSRHRYPLRGSQSDPPETSSPLTHNRTSPLIPRM